MHSLRCERGGDDGGGEIEAIDLWEPCSDGFFKHDLSGSSLVGVEAPDLDRLVFSADACLIGDGSLGVTFEELFRDELFHEDLFSGVAPADELFINFPGIPTKFEAIPWGGIDNTQNLSTILTLLRQNSRLQMMTTKSIEVTQSSCSKNVRARLHCLELADQMIDYEQESKRSSNSVNRAYKWVRQKSRLTLFIQLPHGGPDGRPFKLNARNQQTQHIPTADASSCSMSQ